MSASAAEIARALHGRRYGRWWRVICPIHGGQQPSLALWDGDTGVLVRCFAGCEWKAVKDELARRGLLDQVREDRPPFRRPLPPTRAMIADGEALTRRKIAAQIWERSFPARRSPMLQRYLRARGITIPIPDSLRFLPMCRHPTGTFWAAMIARIDDVGSKFLAIQRTYLAEDGSAKAPVEPNRLTLGSPAGGAVRLGEPDRELVVAEGVETALSVTQLTGRPCWAICGHVNLRTLQLPFNVADLLIASENDPKPRARLETERSIEIAVERFSQELRRVWVVRPPETVKDFNDVLRVGR